MYALTVPCCSAPASASDAAPKAPKSTFPSDRFMASHMILVRMIPDAPTSDPLITSASLSSTKPAAQAARPE